MHHVSLYARWRSAATSAPLKAAIRHPLQLETIGTHQRREGVVERGLDGDALRVDHDDARDVLRVRDPPQDLVLSKILLLIKFVLFWGSDLSSILSIFSCFSANAVKSDEMQVKAAKT